MGDNSKCVELININEQHNKEIILLESQIKKLKQEIENNEKEIWKTCSHEWERESTCYDESVKYYCKKCSLWKNSAWYT